MDEFSIGIAAIFAIVVVLNVAAVVILAHEPSESDK